MSVLENFQRRFQDRDLKNTTYQDLAEALEKGNFVPGNPASKIKFVWLTHATLSLDFFDGFQSRKGVTLEGEPLLILFKDSFEHENESVPHYYLRNPNLLEAFSFSFQTVSGGATVHKISHFLLFPLMPFQFTKILGEGKRERTISAFAGLVKLLASRASFYHKESNLLPYLHPRNLFFDWDYNFIGLEMLGMEELGNVLYRTVALNKFFPQLFLYKSVDHDYHPNDDLINGLNLLCFHFGNDIEAVKFLIYPNTPQATNLSVKKTQKILNYALESLLPLV